MEEDKENKIIKKILSQGSEIKAPYDMSERVLSVWKTQLSNTLTLSPLIPFWFWCVLSVFFLGILYRLSLSVTIASEPSYTLTIIKKGLDYVQFDFLNLDHVMITALGIFGIMIFINSFLINIQFHRARA